MADGFTEFPILIITFVAGAAVVVSLFISKLVRRVTIAKVSNTDAQEQCKISLSNASKKSSHQSHSNKSNNKKKYGDKHGRDGKRSFHHQWLLTSLKGHSSNVLDMEFSPNGKFLATCGEEEREEPDPGGGDENANSSGSEGNKENAAVTSRPLVGRSQKKSRRGGRGHEDGSPANASNKMKERKAKRMDASGTVKRWNQRRTNQFRKLSNVSDAELSTYLRHYALTPEQIMSLGYPVESSLHPGRAIIYRSTAPRGDVGEGADGGGRRRRGNSPAANPSASAPSAPCFFDVNAREFVPAAAGGIRDWRCIHGDALESGESGGGSGSSRRSGDSDGSGDSDPETRTDGDSDDGRVPRCDTLVQRLLSSNDGDEPRRGGGSGGGGGGDEKRCARCGRGFFLVLDGGYLTREKCHYHWGKLQRVSATTTTTTTNNLGTASAKSEFTCCKGRKNSKGCTTAKLHVWNGVAAGVNGPLDGFVKTKPLATPPNPPDGNYGIYAMDCEMCYTMQGLELTKITVVATDGRTVYDTFVKPENAIIDYNTRFSGITAKDLGGGKSAKCLRDVQSDLMAFINADTILIGHGLENDLKALKMIHSTIIDTSVMFPHYYGLPYRRSLRSLVNSFLKRDIQSYSHDSFEDAIACMELVLWRVKKDFNNSFDHKTTCPFIEKF